MPKIILKEKHKEFICNLIAQYKQQDEIIEELRATYDIKILPNQITRIRQKKYDLIEKLRNVYLFNLAKVPIAQKRVRLERLEGIYEVATTIDPLKQRISMQLKCLNAAQTEVEGKVGAGTVYNTQINQYSNLSDKDLKEKIKRLRSEILDLAKDKENRYALPSS